MPISLHPCPSSVVSRPSLPPFAILKGGESTGDNSSPKKNEGQWSNGSKKNLLLHPQSLPVDAPYYIIILQSNGIISLSRGRNNKYLKPPLSSTWNLWAPWVFQVQDLLFFSRNLLNRSKICKTSGDGKNIVLMGFGGFLLTLLV